MRIDNEDYTFKNSLPTKEPRYTIELAFDFANTDLHYFTSHADAKVPNASNFTPSTISKGGISGTSQKIKPNKGLASIGSLTIKLIDKDSAISTLFNTKLDIGLGLRGKRVRIYHSFIDSDWSDYVLIQTQIIDRVTYKDGAYTIYCADVQRSERKQIFEQSTTTLSRSVSATQTLIPVYSVDGFDLIAHGSSYSDAPNQKVLYIQIEKEIVRCTGTITDQVLGLSFIVDTNGRGVLNTTAAIHNIDTTLSDNSRKTKVEEFIYLELPVVKLMYAILTGDLIFQTAGDRLPDKYHLNIDPDYVRLVDFLIIGTDWYDNANDQNGVICRFIGLKKQDGKKFIEQELDLLLGAFNPVYSDGSLGLKRMTSILSNAGYVKELNESNLANYSDLLHDMRSVQNLYQINWNYDHTQKVYTRKSLLVDATSISTHGSAVLTELNFLGLNGSRHTEDTLFKLFDSLRDRYAGPPLRLNVTCLPSLSVLEVGDVVRINLNNVRDFNGALAPLDRSFEVQGVTIDWLTGKVNLELFGSSQSASSLSNSKATYVLNDSFYTKTGIELKNYIDTNYPGNFVLSGSVGHITGNVTLPGNDPASIYYYNNPLTIDAGVTVTITQTVELRIRGHITYNGIVTGVSQGLAGGATDPSQTNPNLFGNSGYLGNTKANGSIDETGPGARSTECKLTTGKAISIDLFSLKNDRSTNTLGGVPASLVGSSGSGGANRWYGRGTPVIWLIGGSGGNSGAGLITISRGASFGASGMVDLSGQTGAGAPPDQFNRRAGSGAGGAPGCWLILLDGATVTIPDAGSKFRGYQGDTPVFGNPYPTPLYNGFWSNPSSYYRGYGTPAPNRSSSAYRIQFIPEDPNAVADPPLQAVISPKNFQISSGENEILINGDGSITSRIRAAWTASIDQNIGGYELEYKKSSDTAWLPASQTVNLEITVIYISPVQDRIQYDVRLRAINNVGIRSAWVTVMNHRVIGKTAPPPDCDMFLVQRLADGTRQFDGGLNDSNVPVDFSGYRIRARLGTGFTWNTLTPLHKGLITQLPYETNQLAAGNYMAGIKAVDTTGNESLNAVFIQSTLGDPRIQNALATEDPKLMSFPGVKTGCYVDSITGNLESINTNTWDSFGSASPPTDWDNWLSWTLNWTTPITYEHPIIDVGLVTTVTPIISVTGNGVLLIEESHSDDNASFSAWAVVGAMLTTRYIKTRVIVSNSVTAPNVSQMLIVFDAAFISETISDLDTSTLTGSNRIAVGDIRLPILKSYGLIKTVQLALQSVGAGWSWEIIDKDTAIGPRVKIYNSSAVLADALIDASISGV